MMTKHATDEEMQAMGASMRRARREAGYTQAGLAKEIGVTAQVVSNWERGVSSPYGENMIDMADLYDCSIDYLMGMTETKERKWAR